MLPRLIFAEHHNDPVTPRQLTRLLPILKSLGYKVYLSETPEKLTLDAHEKYLEGLAAHYNRLCDLIDTVNGNEDFGITLSKDMRFLPNDERMEKCIMLILCDFALSSNDSLQSVIDIYNSVSFYREYTIRCAMNTLIAMDRFESTPANLQLMSALRQENITYRGIDLLVRTSWSIDRFERRILDPKRNTNMGGLILTNEENSISRIGSSHSKLIRDELLQALSPEVVDARYCFINLRSLPPLYTQEVNDKCDNCVRFDCQNMDDEALTEAIMQLIKQKQEAFHQLYPALCDKACADLDRHLESLSDERNKHGKYGLWAAFMANRSLTESTATQKLKQYLAAKNPEEALPDFSRDEIKAFGNKQLGPLVTRFNLEGIMPSLNELNQRLSVTHQRWHRK